MRVIVAVGCVVAAWAVVSGSSRVRELGVAEAEAARGAVNIDDRRCLEDVATCNDYNAGIGLVFTCPSAGACAVCEFDDLQWDMCVSSTGDTCEWLGGGGANTDCGDLRAGSCDGAICSASFSIGDCEPTPSCNDVP